MTNYIPPPPPPNAATYIPPPPPPPVRLSIFGTVMVRCSAGCPNLFEMHPKFANPNGIPFECQKCKDKSK